MKIFNTLTRNKEEFAPAGKKVTMYSCGPTVYNFAHIGNMRTYIFMDLVRRVLVENGFRIKGVLNITDVGHLLSDADEGEDKMSLAARREQKSPYEIADFYTKIFFDDIARLNIGRPEITAKATDHIPEMLAFAEALFDKGFAYETSDGIYFDIGKFPEYGQLSGINLDDQQAGARVEVNTEKRHPADFALWKKADARHIMQWDTPRWGRGYPGWHIECSAMARKYLGDTFDIHTGGVDHIPIHHENEIAQSESLTGVRAARFWMHGEFMQFDGGKMSKSLGNVYTVSDLVEKGYRPLDFRYFCLNAHYRKKINFTFTALDAAHTALDRLYQAVYSHKGGTADVLAATIDKYRSDFRAAIDDDINIPMALGILWTLVKDEPKSDAVYRLAIETDRVFGLDLAKYAPPAGDAPELPPEIQELADARIAARKSKDWAQSDALRDRLNALGYAVADTPAGQKITRE